MLALVVGATVYLTINIFTRHNGLSTHYRNISVPNSVKVESSGSAFEK